LEPDTKQEKINPFLKAYLDNKKADDIVALIKGEPGPFMEDEKSFFGKKRVDSNMKDKKMETGCGGMVVTKAAMTYGEADIIAKNVNSKDVIDYIKKFNKPFCFYPPKCYWEKNKNPDIGEMWWAIYSYLAHNKIIEGKRDSYKNSMEYLFDEILKNMVREKLVVADEDWIYFKIC
jgi:hypothetical protein